MFWKKPEKKRCSPCIKLLIYTAGAVGAIAFLKKGKNMATCKMKQMMSAIKCTCRKKDNG
jgi:hypothetical protein